MSAHGTVTLKRVEYEAMVRRIEDLEDARDLRAAAAAADEREHLPAATVKRMIAGEHPLRVWREHRGLSLSDLAARSGVGASYLAEIETGRKPGSVRAYKAAATALGVEIDDLVP